MRFALTVHGESTRLLDLGHLGEINRDANAIHERQVPETTDIRLPLTSTPAPTSLDVDNPGH
jgi:hypothetical protein